MIFENTIIELNNLKDDQYLSFDKMEYWLLKYNTLYSQTKYNYDCSENNLPCMCRSRKKDCLFIDVFDALEIISKMYYKNLFYTNELIRYDKIKQDHIEVEKWLFENLEENDIDLPYSSTNEIYYDKVISLRNGKNVEKYNTYILKFKGEDFKSSYDFFYLHNELFFKQKILPNEYEIWKKESGYIDFEE